MFHLKKSLRAGIGFGLTSSVITTLGLIIGLNAGTAGSRVAILGGLLTIAIADSLSDAMGMHISRESEKNASDLEIWEITLATFLSKFILTLTFAIPLFLLPLTTALIISLTWGALLLLYISYLIAKKNQDPPFHVISEHLLIATLVIFLTHKVGEWVSHYLS